MKKTVLIVLAVLAVCAVVVSAASYMDNPYQKLAREYKAKSEKAFDEGEYDAAVEYSALAEENADLSDEYVAEMLAKYEANSRIIYARNKLLYAKNLKADVYYPMAFGAAQKALDNALLAYELKNWGTATLYAEECINALEGIKEVKALPQYYIVTPWARSKDCYWNISGKPFIYNNPLLWENLYQANKSSMKDPANPDLIYPGMKMLIPSLTGEIREGVYSPSVKYDPYNSKASPKADAMPKRDTMSAEENMENASGENSQMSTEISDSMYGAQSPKN